MKASIKIEWSFLKSLFYKTMLLRVLPKMVFIHLLIATPFAISLNDPSYIAWIILISFGMFIGMFLAKTVLFELLAVVAPMSIEIKDENEPDFKEIEINMPD